jgi:hypothetical protein
MGAALRDAQRPLPPAGQWLESDVSSMLSQLAAGSVQSLDLDHHQRQREPEQDDRPYPKRGWIADGTPHGGRRGPREA